MNSYLTCRLLLKHIHVLNHKNNFNQYKRVKHQVESTHQNIEYLQDITHHRKVVVPHHYCNHCKKYPLSLYTTKVTLLILKETFNTGGTFYFMVYHNIDAIKARTKMLVDNYIFPLFC